MSLSPDESTPPAKTRRKKREASNTSAALSASGPAERSERGPISVAARGAALSERSPAPGRSELRVRLVLGPIMLLLVAAIYWIDLRYTSGRLSAVALGENAGLCSGGSFSDTPRRRGPLCYEPEEDPVGRWRISG